MAKTVDATKMREINKRSVMEIIFNRGPVSRIEISQRTGLNKATVSSLVDDLITEQFVNEIGLGTSSGGRKPVLLQFHAQTGYCIGVDIQITHTTTVLTDLMGGVVYQRVRPMPGAVGRLTQADLENILVDEIQCAATVAPASIHGIIGAGVALPGIVNFQTGCAFHLPNIEIRNWEVCARLSEYFPFPIFIDNDGNCGALSEARHRDAKNMVFINVGVGIGTGILINGELYRGAHGIAGEFGHTSISAIGALCACGNYGCWEQYASEQALFRYLKEESHEPGTENLSPDLIEEAVQQAAAGSAAHVRAFETLGRYLGIGIGNIVNGLNPDLIIIGGTISKGAQFFQSTVQSVVQHRAMAWNKQIPIEIAQPDAIVLGASRLCVLNTLMQSPFDQD